ncbi:hypothetical protein NW762_004107 [Fusarium torreyae]|uniref:RING-type domain-containing protein n=1 Tax=Fusarium torreyae TaxID=1237075 RepID=A0A9W8S5D9_9HYPO|nr:hypothetical protein NW762_004107 [Fusarium torreyae]
MATPIDPDMQKAAQLQLDYLREWEEAHNTWGESHMPQEVLALRAIRVRLEAVAANHSPWKYVADAASRERILKDIEKSSLPCGSIPAAEAAACSAIARDANSRATASQENDPDNVVDRFRPVGDTLPVVAPPGAPTTEAAHADVAPHSEVDSEEDIYSDDKDKVPSETPMEARRARITPAVNALSFLSEAAVGHIRLSKAMKPAQPSPVKDALNEPENKSSDPSNIEDTQSQAGSEATEIVKREPFPAFHHQDDEEDLISFDTLPSGASTPPLIQIADEVPPPIAKSEGPVERVAHDTGSGASLVEGSSDYQNDEGHVSSKVPGDDDAKCVKCDDDLTDSMVKCPCLHSYCSTCLYNLVKSSIRGETAFPPTCCEVRVPVDANSDMFSGKILHEFLAKRYGKGLETPNLSPLGRHNLNSMPTPPKEDQH